MRVCIIVMMIPATIGPEIERHRRKWNVKYPRWALGKLNTNTSMTLALTGTKPPPEMEKEIEGIRDVIFRASDASMPQSKPTRLAYW